MLIVPTLLLLLQTAGNQPQNNTIFLPSLTGEQGFIFQGNIEFGFAGIKLGGLGDINADGFADIAIRSRGLVEQHLTYLIFGAPDLPRDISPSSPAGAQLRSISAPGPLGGAARGIGDIDGDGIADFAVGNFGGLNTQGSIYVVFGNESRGFPTTLTGVRPPQGFRVFPRQPSDSVGRDLASAGDFNGDGIDDFVLGDPRYVLDSGMGAVVYGSSNRPQSDLLLSLAVDGEAYQLLGSQRFSELGNSVRGIGDINGDGRDDVVVGADDFDADPAFNVGAAYVVFGVPSGSGVGISDLALNGENGFSIIGATRSGELGKATTGLGDFNGDGIDDFAVSEPGGGTEDDGNVYVIYGSTAPFPASLDLSSIDGENGFVITLLNERESIGKELTSVGDVNGDGLRDLLLTSDSSRYVYLIFGRKDSFGSEFFLQTLNGSNGLRLERSESVQPPTIDEVGDVNGDGIDDLLIGSPFTSDLATAGGTVFLLYGNASPKAESNLALLPDGLEDSMSDGLSVQDLFAGIYSDSDPIAGVALISNFAEIWQGNWEYRMPGGSWFWIPNELADTSALILTPDVELRFRPGPNFSGEPGALVARMWDGQRGITPTSRDIRFAVNSLGGLAGDEHLVGISVIIEDVNDRPSFTAVDPPPTIENDGPQQVVFWAAFDPGTGFELDQRPAFEVLDWDGTLLIAPPAITPAGALTYEAAPDTSGTTRFSVRVVDDGGVANGGINVSEEQEFQITVVPGSDRTFSDGFETP